jgi:hypothetical protein
LIFKKKFMTSTKRIKIFYLRGPKELCWILITVPTPL